MSSPPPSFTPEDLLCPVCRDVFRDPVILRCSHSFCKACLREYWELKTERECPVCRGRSPPSFPSNLALRNLCEAFLEERSRRASEGCGGSGALCVLHGEKLKLFCLDDRRPVCLVCRDSEKHGGHAFRPVYEAARDLREEAEARLGRLRERLEAAEEAKRRCDQAAARVQVQARRAERQIEGEFARLRRFLREEEEARTAALREEEERKSRTMKERMEELDREMSSLSDCIGAAEEDLRADDISFLQNHGSTLTRARCEAPDPPHDPPQGPGALIDEAQHLGNLAFRVWDKMKDVVRYTPVVLDPNTAHPGLVLSEDLSGARDGDGDGGWVLGAEGFDSGTHSWDVEVGEGAHWLLGVAARPVGERGRGGGKDDPWRIAFHRGGGGGVGGGPRRIRVQLDWDAGRLSFYDPHANTHLHTVTHAFTERVYPYLLTCSPLHAVRIAPGRVTVRVEPHG